MRSKFPLGKWEKLTEGQPLEQHSINQAFWYNGQAEAIHHKKAHDSVLEVCQKAHDKLSDHEKKSAYMLKI